MKTKACVTIGFLLGLTAITNAFSLDFSGNVGVVLAPGPLTISVPGYGNVQFDAQAGVAEVDTSQLEGGVPVPSLVFDSGDVVRVTFLGLAPQNVTSGVLGLNSGESFLFLDSSDPAVFFYQFSGVAGADAGLQTVSWGQVPEPSSALLGVLGTAVLAFRRRR